VSPPEDQTVRFGAAYALEGAAEVALEDYARVLTRAESAEALRAEPDGVGSVRVLAPQAELTPQVCADIEAFARDLAGREGKGGLGWA
jgi:hypothetical protein